ncbi:MAG: EpsG family protein [Anaerosacchariphilus sp.]
MSVLYLLCLLVGGISLVTNKTSKRVTVFLIISLIILAAAPRSGYDTSNYIDIYNTVQKTGISAYNAAFYKSMRGYLYLINVANIIGLPTLYTFKFVTLSILVMGICNSFGKLCSNNNSLIFLYLISTFSIDAIQHRNTIALLLFLIGFYFLITRRKYSKILFAFFVGMASIIHITYVVYFLFLIAQNKDITIRTLIKCLLPITLAVMGIVFFNISLLDMFVSGVGMFFSNKINNGYLSFRTHFGVIYPFLIYTTQIMMLSYCSKQLKSNRNKYLYKERYLTDIVFRANILIYPTIFLAFFSLSTDRMLRNLTIINLLVFINFLNSGAISKNKRKLGYLCVIGASLFNMVYINFITGPASDILFAVLKGKLFFV